MDQGAVTAPEGPDWNGASLSGKEVRVDLVINTVGRKEFRQLAQAVRENKHDGLAHVPNAVPPDESLVSVLSVANADRAAEEKSPETIRRRPVLAIDVPRHYEPAPPDLMLARAHEAHRRLPHPHPSVCRFYCNDFWGLDLQWGGT